MSDCWPEQEVVDKWLKLFIEDTHEITISNQDKMKLKEAVTEPRIEVQQQLSDANDRIKELETELGYQIDGAFDKDKTIERLCDALLEAADYVSMINGEEPQKDWKKYEALVAEIKNV